VTPPPAAERTGDAPNGPATQVSPKGDMENQYIQACSGSPMNYNALTHELRVDHTSDTLRVLTTQVPRRLSDRTSLEQNNNHPTLTSTASSHVVTRPSLNRLRFCTHKYINVRSLYWTTDYSSYEMSCNLF
jgi:hypothetical protein